MPLRQKYHFEPENGWMNDPNGLIYFRGKYHIFYQFNPHSPHWDTMHWGHSFSDDLVNFENLPIALFPDKPYDKKLGCWSGTAIEHKDRLYLFYTSVGEQYGQTQSVAWSDDGINFTKYEGNPIIMQPKGIVNGDFRDPKVFKYENTFYMLVCARFEDGGKILMYKSDDLLKWSEPKIFFSNFECGIMPECVDFFPLCEKGSTQTNEYILMFSRFSGNRAMCFVHGKFNGEEFQPKPGSTFTPEAGPHFYAPQTVQTLDNRIILFGWVVDRAARAPNDQRSQGCLSLPRELTIEDGKLRSRPAREIACLLDKQSFDSGNIYVVHDSKTVEIFDNGGMNVLTYWQNNAAASDVK